MFDVSPSLLFAFALVYGIVFLSLYGLPTELMSSVLAALVFSKDRQLAKDGSLETILPEDVLRSVLQYVPNDLSLHLTSKYLRGLSMFPLTEAYSTQYIQDETFRNQVNARLVNPRAQLILHLGGRIAKDLISRPNMLDALLANPRKQVRLNLGKHFRWYMVNPEQRAEVDALVENPLQQIWSDVTDLILCCTQVEDIRPLGALVNLGFLDLHGSAVTDISPLSRLVNLQELILPRDREFDMRPLAHLPYLRIHHWTSERSFQVLPLSCVQQFQNCLEYVNLLP